MNDLPPEARAALRSADVALQADLVGKSFIDMRDELHALWLAGLPSGTKTGWPSVDKLYTVAPGQLTIITGWPSSGKSEWLDALLLNLARQAWRFAIFSPENKPESIHAAKFLEKFLGKPFGHGPTERMTMDEALEAATELADAFAVLTRSITAQRELFSPEQILVSAENYFGTHGWWRKKENPLGLVIDPWNELEHLRPREYSETEYVSATLSMIRAWARDNSVHVWIVAHPQKLKREDGRLPIPTPDTISGSQHWWNKADNCITVFRNFDQNPQDVDIYVQKVRFKHIGHQGRATLIYDRITGRYHEKSAQFSVVGS